MIKHSLGRGLAFLALVLLVAFIVCANLDGALAIDEVVDDYTDTSSVNVTVEVVHNPTLDVMQLNLTLAVGYGVPMDIWTTGGFTEVEQGADHLKNINGTEIWFDNVDRDEGDRIFKGFGANYFDVYFNYYFRFRVAPTHENNPRCYFMVMAEENLDMYTSGLVNGKNLCGFFTQWRTTTGKWEVQIRMYDGAVWAIDTNTEAQQFDLNKWYHVIYIRDGDNATAWFYNDRARTDLDFMLTVVNDDVDNLRYFHPLNAEDRVGGGVAMDMWLLRVRNQTVGWGYEPVGYFTTTNLMTGLSHNITVVLVNTSIPGGTINLEWSPDGAAWTDLGGVPPNTWAFDLRGAGSQDAILRFNFTRGGPNITPRLYQVRLIHEGGVAPAMGAVDVNIYYALAIILLLVGLMIGWGDRVRP